ncbi:MAG: hypothetical protein RIC85_02350 [Gammaproteobacteria bacterium]
MTHDPLGDLFHQCGLHAFLIESRRCRDWPDSEATRRLAYALYEMALAEKNASKLKNKCDVHLTVRTNCAKSASHD